MMMMMVMDGDEVLGIPARKLAIGKPNRKLLVFFRSMCFKKESIHDDDDDDGEDDDDDDDADGNLEVP